jgi:hypothetical protein
VTAHSKLFKNVDLKVLQFADSAAFSTAIAEILVSATAIPAGFLAQPLENKSGHNYTRFFGRPSAWMNRTLHRLPMRTLGDIARGLVLRVR